MTLPLRSCGIVSLAMKSFAFLLVFVLSLTAHAADAPAGAKPEEPRQLLQQGLFEEEANRDFEKAADAYARLLKEYDRQRAFAATALFRLAEIRAKQGNKTEAIALHQRLLAEFPNHDPLAKLSRERLAALGGTAPLAADVAEAPTASEASELARVREMVRNSPDLVNAVRATSDGAAKETPLGIAAKNGWLQVATFLLDHGAEVNGVPDSAVPLTLAAREGHKSLVELLLARGARMNPSSTKVDSALIVACANRRVEVARLLLDRGADPKLADGVGVTALHAACVANIAEIARILLEKGASPNAIAGRGAQIPGRADLALDGTPLHFAVARQHGELVELLLAHGADANIPSPTEQTTTIILAVRNSDESMATLLLKHGARPDLADENGNSALHYAAQIRAPQLVQLLLDHGASPNVVNKEGATPSHASLIGNSQTFTNAISKRRSGFAQGGNRADETPMSANDVAALRAIWEALAGKGVDFNAGNQFGWTPLHYAVGLDQVPVEAALWLIEHGADLQIKDKSGTTPLQFAEAKRRIFFEKRFVFPKLIKERAVSALIRTASQSSGEPERIESVAEFESPPTLLELLREKFAAFVPTAAAESAELVVYRGADGDAIEEIARARLNFDDGSNTLRLGAETDATKWPALRWGNVIVFEGGKSPSNRVGRRAVRNSPEPDVLPHTPVMVSVQLGERSRQLKIGDIRVELTAPTGSPPPGNRVVRQIQSSAAGERVWSPSEPLPLWRFSELIERVIAAEPRAQLDAVKVQRPIDGTVKEWIVDMRAGDGVKELPARISDGDTIIIPLRPASLPEALSKRRTGIFQSAPGRMLGQQVFQRRNQDSATRTLAEFLMQSYLAGEMIVPLPDLAKVTIYRLKGESSEEEKLTIDFTKTISAATDKISPKDARALDVPLEWGDIVELQPAPGSAEQWTRFTPQTVLYLNKALTRAVQVWVNGAEKGEISLEPAIPMFGGSERTGVVQGASRRTGPPWNLSPFSVSEVARRANVQLDELVKVTIRSGEDVREFTPDQLRAIEPWVQDGDRVEFERL